MANSDLKKTQTDIKNDTVSRGPIIEAKDNNSINDSDASKDSASDEDDDDSLFEEIEALDYVIVNPQPEEGEGAFTFITNKIFGDITGFSATKQFVIGGAVGFTAGYLGYNVAKTAALGVGSCLLLLQIAQHNGIITVHWANVKHCLTKAEAKIKKTMIKNKDPALADAKTFYENNTFMATGFATGVAAAVAVFM